MTAVTSHPLYTMDSEVTVAEVIAMLTRHRVRQLPVVASSGQ